MNYRNAAIALFVAMLALPGSLYADCSWVSDSTKTTVPANCVAGIGTSAAPDAPLTVQGGTGDVINVRDTAGQTRFRIFAHNSSYYMDLNSGNYDLRLTSATSSGSGGNISFLTSASGAATERMRILPSGYVGIGRSPVYPFDVFGANAGGYVGAFTANTSANGGIARILVQTTATQGAAELDVVNDSNYTNGGYAMLQTGKSLNLPILYAALDHRFWAGGAERMRIDSAGNIGVGLTPGTFRFDVNGGLRVSNAGGAGVELQNYSSTANRILSYNRTASTYQDLFFGTSTAENTLYLNTSGNVGVGMTSGSVYRLDVNGGLRVSNNANAGIELGNVSPSANRIISYNRTALTYQNLYFGTTGSENTLYLNTDGNVGVGTSTISERLTVNGCVKADGFKFSDGSQLAATSGKLGIGTGTAAPKALLQVRDAANSVASPSSVPDPWLGMLVERSADGAAAGIAIQGGQKIDALNHKGAARIYLGNADEWDSTLIEGGAGKLSFYVRNNGAALSSPALTINANGDLKVQGNIEAKYQDVAEWVSSGGQLAVGTVVIINPGQKNEVMPSSHAYDTSVAGVVSDMPGLLLGEAGDTKSKIATTGRVRVHVDATKRAINAGDLLVTSEKPGVAMASEPIDLAGTKIHRPGTLIGKALEPLQSGEGEILVLLSLQ